MGSSMISRPYFWASRSSATFSIADFVTDQTPQRSGVGVRERAGRRREVVTVERAVDDRGRSDDVRVRREGVERGGVGVLFEL